MSSLKTMTRIAAAAGMLVLAVACARVPSAEVTAAEQALSAARNAEAATFATAEWQQALEAMNAAKAEIAAQESRFALLRTYSKATEMLAQTKSLAGIAERAGLAGREKARKEAEAALARVRTDLDVATELLAELEGCQSRPKGFAQDLELLKGNLQGLIDSLPEIEAAINKGHIQETRTLASSLQNEVTTFVADLNTARTKLKC